MQERLGQLGEYWLSKREGSDNWCRTWYDEPTRQTKRVSLGTADLQKAKIALYNWHSQHGKITKESPQSVPVAQVFVRYYQQHGKGLASAEFVDIALGLWSEFFGTATVAEVTPARQREFVTWLASTGTRGDGYIKRILGVGKAALSRAYREGELESVPFVLPGQDGEARDRVLTLAESQRIWDAAHLPHERMFLALAFCTMARPEAILDLQRSQVDFMRRLLAQNPPGRRQTRKYRPTVPVCAFLLPWLDAAPAGHLVNWHGKPIASFKTAWRGIRRRAGLGPEVVAKTIRHTIATELRAANVPEPDIQGMLGHKAYSARTEDYAKYRPDYLGQAIAVIDGYMSKLRASRVLDGQK